MLRKIVLVNSGSARRNPLHGRPCGKCGKTEGRCPECRGAYPHGNWSRCPRPKCRSMNAPVDCAGCGCPVADDLSGVLTADGDVVPWREYRRKDQNPAPDDVPWDWVRARAAAVAARGRCVCGKRRVEREVDSGIRRWVGCDRCLGVVRQLPDKPIRYERVGWRNPVEGAAALSEVKRLAAKHGGKVVRIAPVLDSSAWPIGHGQQVWVATVRFTPRAGMKGRWAFEAEVRAELGASVEGGRDHEHETMVAVLGRKHGGFDQNPCGSRGGSRNPPTSRVAPSRSDVCGSGHSGTQVRVCRCGQMVCSHRSASHRCRR